MAGAGLLFRNVGPETKALGVSMQLIPGFMDLQAG
jgi:hypothetical protein